MADPLSNIYSPENIARSRARAAIMQQMIDDGTLPATYQQVVSDMLAYAGEREAAALHG